MREIAAIVLARGGSKRLPRKNVKLLDGKPMIAYTIQAALESVGNCYVSTDNDEIEKVSLNYGATVIRRDPELARDDTPATDVLYQLFIQSAELHDFTGTVVLLNPTSPLRHIDHIRDALNYRNNGNYDTVLSVCPYNKFLWQPNEFSAVPLNYEPSKRPRSQGVSPVYQENGAIYICSADHIRQTGNFLGGNIGLYKMPYWESFEVDTAYDFDLVEQLI